MLKTNYRCVQSLNISLDDAKCVEMFTNPESTLTFCPYLSWLNNLFMSNFQLTRMSSYAKNKPQMCSVTQHQCRWRQMCGKCSQIHQVHSVFVRTCPDWTIYSWQTFNSLGCPHMLRTNYRCVQSLNISVDVAKCAENVHKFTQFTHFLSVTKNDLSWLNNLFVARFQLISISSYAKNKLQMCSVTQHQCRWRQMCGKCSQIHQVHSLFVRTCPDWTIYSCQTFNSQGCPLMLRTNYRCVESLNISVDVAKCVENVHTSIHKTVKRFQMKSTGCRDVQHTGLQSTQTRRNYSSNNTGKQDAQTRGHLRIPKHPYISGCTACQTT